MIPTRPGGPLWVAALLLLSLFAAPGAGVRAMGAEARSATADSVASLRAAGDLAAALDLCRAYNAAQPGDAVMLYNEACLHGRLGDPDAAARAFRSALGAGFAALDYALQDPDLGGDTAPAIASLVAGERQRLAALAVSRSLALAPDAWSQPLRLTPDPGPVRAAPPGPAELRLRWRDTGLELELTAPPAYLRAGMAAPWQEERGLVVTVAAGDKLRPWIGTDAVSFAFGNVKGGGLGAMWVPAGGGWQWIRELDPKLADAPDGRTVLTTLVPWRAIAPLHPLVDAPLGFNATLLGAAGAPSLSLLENPAPLAVAAPEKRVAPLDFAFSDPSEDMFWGRIAATVTGDAPVTMDFNAVSTVAGAAELAVDFMDAGGASVLPGGARQQTVDLQPGPNLFSRQADFSQLPTGSYAVRVEIRFPTGRTAVWGSSVLHLSTGWREAFEERIAAAPDAERRTLERHLDTVVAALAEHAPRRSPGVIATTLGDLAGMLDTAAATGTILPEQGVLLFLYRDELGRERTVHLAVPPGREPGTPVAPVIMAGVAPHEARAMAARILRNYEYGEAYRDGPARTAAGAWPVYVVPEERPGAGAAERASGLAAACAWAGAYFEAERLLLVGVDDQGPAALREADRRGDGAAGLMLFVGEDFARWAAGAGSLPPAPRAPLTWTVFPSEAMQAGVPAATRTALQSAGYATGEWYEVRGGLNLTQVADRTVLWVSGGKPPRPGAEE